MRKLLTALGLVAFAATVVAAEFQAAEPVWPQGRETERNLFVGFRAQIDGRAAKLRYSASSIARVWLNGKFLAYGPARGPHGVDRIDEIDLNGRLTNGVNTLAFEVAGYNVDSFYLINEPAYLAAEVLDATGKVIAATKSESGAFTAFVLDERVQKVPRFSYQRPFCEVYALKPDANAWRTGAAREPVKLAKAAGSPKWIDRVFPYPDYSVSQVFRPIRAGTLELHEPEPKRVGRSVSGETDPKRGFSEKEIVIQPVYEVRELACGQERPLSVGALQFQGSDFVLLDHELCDTGFLGARIVCTKPGKLYFNFDEVMVKDDIDVARMGWQCVNTITYDFKVPGVYEVEAFEPNTFRYLKVMADGFAGSVEQLYLRGYKNAAALKKTFVSDDPALDRIFAAARETFAQNAVDCFTDCPSRERAGWLCDSFFTARAALLFTGNTDMEKGFLQNYALSTKTFHGGFLQECYPADDYDFIPNWNLWLILEVGEYLQRSGDRALVNALRPKLEGVIAAFRKFRNADGLLEKLPGWGFVEWSFANKLVQDVSYPSNMLYAEALDTMARVYGLADCADEAKRVRETIRQQSWTGEWFCDNAVRQPDGKLKLSGECTETCQYYAFFFHVATANTHPELWKRLVTEFGPQRKTTKQYPKIHFSNAFIGNFLRLELLSRAGLTEQLVKEIRGYFLGMADKTGTLWEHDNTSASCVHGFASHVAVWLSKHVAPVQHGILCLTFDDPHWERWVKMMPLFEKYGARVSFFPCGPLDTNAVQCLKRLHDAGHTVGPHTQDHADAPEYFAKHGAEAYWQNEVKPEMDAFASVGIVPHAMAYPNNRHTEETDAFLATKGFRRFRAGVPNKGYAPQKLGKSFVDIDWAYHPSAAFAGMQVAEGFGVGEYYATDIDDLLKGLERAAQRNEVMVIYSHNIEPDAKGVDMKTTWLEQILKRAHELGMSFRTLED